MTLAEHFRASWRLFAPGAASSALIVAAALVPATALLAAAYWATGLTTKAAFDDAARAGEWARALPVVAAGAAARLASMLSYAALVYAADARRAGKPLSAREAYGFAAERFVAFLLTVARALAWIAVGLLLFVIPGLVLAARYCLAHLVVLLEPARGREALARSDALVRPRWKLVVGRLAAGTLAAVALDFSWAAVVAVVMGVAEGMGMDPPGAIGGQLQTLVTELFGGVVGAWLIAYSLLLYRQLAAERAQ